MFGILKTYRKFKRVYRSIFPENVNWIKTILFNFRMLPFREAKHLPIWLYGKVDISHCCGKILWLHGTPPRKSGSWKIGDGSWALDDHLCPNLSIIDIRGELILGEAGVIHNGIKMRVLGGKLTLCDNIYIGDNSKILCMDSIVIGANTHLSWEVQVLDSDSHYVLHDNSYVIKHTRAVKIGSHSWIGNGATVSKGSRIGDYSIIAASSYVNKDFGDEMGCVFASIPARKKAENCRRLFMNEESDLIESIDKWFLEHPDELRCDIDKL